MDGLTEDDALFPLHQLLLRGFAQRRPEAELLGRQVHGCLLLILVIRNLVLK